MISDDEYVKCRLDLILSSQPSKNDVDTAGDELFEYLCKHPLQGKVRNHYLVAVDEGNECLADFIQTMVPVELRPHVTFAVCRTFTDVVAIVRDTLPTMVVIYSNLLILAADKAIAACVAASPGTRYILMTGWDSKIIEDFQKVCVPPSVSIGTLLTPFTREEFLAALLWQGRTANGSEERTISTPGVKGVRE